ncbi:MAG: helix-turn-helix transcriptional regulator [Anaerolineae bacterium]|nr:MAG: helix-turn-helix transcriptional regulator [Anaerolineae bacterium]
MNKPISPFAPERELEACSPRCNPDLQLRVDEMKADQLAGLFKALSHPVRLQMLDLISQGGGEVCVCDLERHFDLTQPTLSHHIKVLREAGLIQSEQNRVWVFHRANISTLQQMRELLGQFIGLS